MWIEKFARSEVPQMAAPLQPEDFFWRPALPRLAEMDGGGQNISVVPNLRI
ncbi:hypothetical protein SNOG_01545 [Parastagonospora nodorum SN15]|uniref:Uncharacterized protein n=1 Tax=Phaeosphaeria nodorum (strain SN15 / ATCC MYA-4574 / FGSC 10173) TaxID=321614 RepID=Q0V369_PHANO|nr:hypothetical protein SNOG_01545 [Parastagonospora nodorum SN15]EAT91194.1 hypothetical protein SNOG_01545 [Parastagonospora nodorum SN15]